MQPKSKFMLGWAVGIVSLASLAVLPSVAMAQRRGPSVTLQLPEFHYFGTSTTVLVPDRGYASMGGISRSSSGQTARSAPLIPFANRGQGHTAGAAHVGVSAWVHDLEAMDKAILAAAHQEKLGCVRILAPSSDVAGENSLVSAEEHARRQAVQQDEQQADAQRHFEKAQALMGEGKPGVARIYFQMALRRAEGPLKAEISAALDASRGPQVAAEDK